MFQPTPHPSHPSGSILGHARALIPAQLRLAAMSVVVAVAFGASMSMAQSDDYAEVNRLVRAGQLSEALTKVDAYLVSKPGDPQMRFLKGVIQTEGGKQADAIATFNKLTEDYPELPEPYNNLAVLYAGQSQFDKARAALEMAIRTNPSYATAHENLGDVYAKLASQAYSKALQLDSRNTAVAPKLSLIRNLFGAETKGAPAPAPAPAPVATAPAPAPAATPAPATATKPAQAPEVAQATVDASNTQAEVEAAVANWAKAWSSRSMSSYLGSYSPNFTPLDGQSRSAWEAERKARIVPRSRIDVDVSDLSVTVSGNKASAQFRQDYSSDTFNVTSRKTLDFVKSGNRWLIVHESTGS